MNSLWPYAAELYRGVSLYALGRMFHYGIMVTTASLSKHLDLRETG